MEHIFRIFDFNVYNQTEVMSSDDEDKNKYQDNSIFEIQIFGINEKGESCSIIAKDYKPFFYIKVGDNWTIQMKDNFLAHIKDKIGKYYANCITDCKIIKRKKLYGFDNGKEHKFIKFEFTNINCFY